MTLKISVTISEIAVVVIRINRHKPFFDINSPATKIAYRICQNIGIGLVPVSMAYSMRCLADWAINIPNTNTGQAIKKITMPIFIPKYIITIEVHIAAAELNADTIPIIYQKFFL